MLERADEPVGAALLAMAAQQQVGRDGWLASAQQGALDWAAVTCGLQAQTGMTAQAAGQHSVKACFACWRWPIPCSCCMTTFVISAPLQAAQLSPENILMREGTYRAIGECFPHLRTKVGGQAAWLCWQVGGGRAAASPACNSCSTCVSDNPLPLPLLCKQVDFGAWYASELRLILTSTELTGAHLLAAATTVAAAAAVWLPVPAAAAAAAAAATAAAAGQC